MDKRFISLKEFYPYYLEEHKDPVCRALHFTGTFLLFIILGLAIVTRVWE